MLRYFVADLHLDHKRPDIIRAFVHFLHEKAAHGQELYLLGDIFEAWIGDDAAPEFLEPVYSALRTLSNSGVKLYFQQGNRDFLVGQAFMQRIGAQLLPECQAIESVHGKTLLLHGDQLCLDDLDYQAFRKQVRDPNWQAAVLSKTVPERLELARQLRAASREQTAQKAMDITDVSLAAVSQLLDDEAAPLMIHGHTHRPQIHHDQSANAGIRIVLGDWNTHGWYLEQDNLGSRLYAFSLPLTQASIAAELRDSLAAPR